MSERFTIEELAARTGMTVRNVREHQTRGLLPPPEIEGRKGFYGDHHLARLGLIQELQAEGLNLQAIAWLIERAPDTATEEVTRFKRALFTPWHDEDPEIYERDELDTRFAAAGSPEALRRAVDLGLLRQRDDGRWEAPRPSLLRAGDDLLALGIPLDAALDVVEVLLEHVDRIAEAFLALFREQILEPFEAGGRSEDDWQRVRDALDRLPPIATQAVLASFHERMAAAVERHASDGGDDLRASA